jgi:hypothetical protein
MKERLLVQSSMCPSKSLICSSPTAMRTFLPRSHSTVICYASWADCAMAFSPACRQYTTALSHTSPRLV